MSSLAGLIQLQKDEIKSANIILWLMIFFYPLLVVPNQLGYFYFPKFIMLTILSVAALLYITRNRKIKFYSCYIPLLLFLLFSLVAAMQATNRTTSFLGIFEEIQVLVENPQPTIITLNLIVISRYTGFLTYFFCAVLFILATEEKNVERVFVWMIRGAAIVSILAVMQYFGIDLVPYEPYRNTLRSFSTMGNPNFLGSYSVFLLPMSIYFSLKEQTIYRYIELALIFSALLVSMTRGSWLTAFLVVIITLCYWGYKEKKASSILKILLTLFIVIILLLPTKDFYLARRTTTISSEVTSAINLEDDAGSMRMYIWKESLKLVPTNLFFGTGQDNLVYEGIVVKSGQLVDKTHNLLIEILVTMGIFAFLSFITFLCFFFKFNQGHLSFFITMMIISYLVQGLFNIEVIMTMPIFWITLGLLLAHSTNYSIANNYNDSVK